MENKEHIDRLYQEKFKDFEVTPNPKVWKNIEASLQKKKRRVLPFWWISGGAVATLLIGLLFYPFSSDEIRNKKIKEEIITEVEEQKPIHFKEEFQIEEHRKPEILKSEQEVIANVKTDKMPNKVFKNKNNNIEKEQFLKKEAIAVVTEDEFKKKVENTSNFSEDLKKKINEKHINQNIVEQKKEVIADKNNYKVLPTKPKKETKDLVAINSEEEIFKEESTNKRWSVTPSVAFLSSQSFNNSSPISANLSNVSGDNSYSYGVKMAYKINKKWELQTGIHLQELKYNTSNVTIERTTTTSTPDVNLTMDELTFSNTNITVTSGANVIANEAKLNQTYGYVEVPLEVKYTFFESSKFSTQIVTGFSSLFLNQNEISAKATNFSKNLGQANNLNSLSFSGNVGVDINYKLLEKLQLNINPMFKQQFSTFSKNSNGFKPYSIGIYTGIRYEF